MRYLLAILFSLLFFAPAVAESGGQELPTDREQIKLSFAPIAKAAMPAVVNIYSRSVVAERQQLFTGDPFFDRFFQNGPLRQRVQSSLGSGVIVSPAGLIVTNVHVVGEASDVRVVLADRREYPARLLVADTQTDLAVLKIDTGGRALPAMPLGDSEGLSVGDLVLAIGNPFGVGQTVTSGIVSALARSAEGVNNFDFFIQTDAAINPGNSGGALVDMNGQLVGINAAIYSRTGGSLGIGFAIPVNLVKTVIAAAENGQSRVNRPYLGAATQAVAADMIESLKLDRPAGVLLASVAPAGSAASAGLKAGDVILSVDNKPVDTPETLRFRLATAGIGATVNLAISRAGEAMSIAMPLLAAPEVPARQMTEIGDGTPFAGATIANLSPALADEIGFAGSPNGVVVLKVDPRSFAARIGLQAGDQLAGINRRRLDSVEETLAILKNPPRRWLLSVRRGSQLLTLAL